MRSIMQGRELELFKVFEPYVVYPPQNGRGIRSDAPPEVVEAYEEFVKIEKAKKRIPYDN